MPGDFASQALTVRFLADTGNLTRGLSGLTGSLRTVAKSVSAIGTVAAGVGTISFFKNAIEEAREAEKLMRQTNAVLKSTGGVANVTAKDIDALAVKISKLSGVDDELVQHGLNVLLTFTAVRNEVGKGNDIFNQAAQLASDMTAALGNNALAGNDLQGSMVRIGKALQDPVKGMTALKKVGVNFTEQQKDQVKALVKSGDMLGAQKLILAELQVEYGGMAAASADAGMKAKVAWDNMAESLGKMVLPVFTSAANVVTEKIVPGIVNLAEKIKTVAVPAFQAISKVVGSVIVWLKDNLLPIVVRVWGVFRDAVLPVVKAVAEFLLEKALKPLWNFLKGNIVPVLSAIVGWLEKNKFWVGLLTAAVLGWTAGWVAYTVVSKAVAIAIGIKTVAMGLLNTVMRANPIFLVVTILGALAGAFIYAWTHSETFRNIVTNVWNAIKNVVKVVWDFLVGAFKGIQAGADYMGRMFGVMRDVVVGVWNAVRGAFQGAWNFMGGIFRAIGDAAGAVGRAFGAMKDAIVTAWKNTIEFVKKPIQGVLNIAYNDTIRALINGVTSFVTTGRWNTNGGVALPRIGFAGGGVLPGYAPGRDSIPAMLSPGEAVLVPELVAQIGAGNILAANRAASGRAPGSGGAGGYAGGGVIGKVIDWIGGTVGGIGKNIIDFIANPAGMVLNAIGNNPFNQMLAKLPGTMIGKVGEWLWNLIKSFAGPDVSISGGGTQSIAALKHWIGTQNLTSKRYQWGATGPNAYDCSGLVGTLWAFVKNKPLFKRYFTTATMGAGKFEMSPNPVKGGFNVLLGPGHTAAEIDGTRVEAHGPNGTPLVVGGGGTRRSFFNRVLHVNLAGGGVLPPLDKMSDPRVRFASWVENGWPEPYIFDNGGLWPSGTLGVNTSGTTEVVTNPKKAGVGEKHYHLHLDVSNHPVDVITQFRRMELMEPSE